MFRRSCTRTDSVMLCGNIVVWTAVVLVWCIMYHGDLICRLLTRCILLTVLRSICVCPKSIFCNFSSHKTQTWTISREVQKNFKQYMLAGSWDVSFQSGTALLSYCNIISPRVYFSYIWKLWWIIKIRKVDCLNRDDRRPAPPGWHNASEMTQSSP